MSALEGQSGHTADIAGGPSISTTTGAEKATMMRRCLAVFAWFTVLCLPLVPGRVAGTVDGAFVAEAMSHRLRDEIYWA